ncbi:hypothetical protein Pcinc_016161, partial [Petrolisthes cinctipes]
NFYGHELRVVTLVYEPFSCYDKSVDGTITPSGHCVDNNMLASLANTLNFTYVFLEPEDGQWGHRLENGSYTGVIGTVERLEADFSLNIAITQDREEVVDCTVGYHVEPITFTTSKPRLLNQALALIRPFSPGVWAAFVALLILAGPVYYALSHLSTIQYHTCLLLRLLHTHHHHHHHSPRLVSSCLVLGSTHPIRFLVGHRGHRSGGLPAAENVQGSTVSAGVPRPTALPVPRPLHHQGQGYQFAFITWRTYLEDRIAVRFTSAGGERQLHVATGDIFPVELGWALTPGCPYTHAFNAAIRTMIEAGLISKWLRDLINDPKRRVEGQEGEDGDVENTTVGGIQALGLDHLQGAFFILLMGCCLACLSFSCEVMKHKRVWVPAEQSASLPMDLVPSSVPPRANPTLLYPAVPTHTPSSLMSSLDTLCS